MSKAFPRTLSAGVLTLAVALAAIGVAPVAAQSPGGSGDNPTLSPGAQSIDFQLSEETAAQLLLLDEEFVAKHTAGDSQHQLSLEKAGALRKTAAEKAQVLKAATPTGAATFVGTWNAIGPSPIQQIARSDNALVPVSGRIGALAIRKNGQFILGAAQGGIWTYDPNAKLWTNRTDNLPSLSTGALVVAPSNDMIVYDGTGEGALSGDSYFGNGILKSVDGGFTWSHVSGDFFAGVSISRLAIDPNDSNHLYAAVLRGRGGARRVSPPIHSTYGLWESKDGAVTWTLLKPAPTGSLGATDIRLDPQQPKNLYASFWSNAIYKSTNGGQTWAPIMNGLPTDANFAAGATRFSLGLSHPASHQLATLYTGFDWVDNGGTHHSSQIFKSIDEGASWSATPTSGAMPDDSVLGYCGGQCFYDNVVEADPTNPDVVFVAGQFGYGLNPPSGGVFRTDDGGQSWKNLGWDQHPDFHALAYDPSNTHNVLIGSDGGVWYSTNRGGRPNATDPLSAVDWIDLNGHGLQITQFTSIATNPTFPVRFWGGSQDNGTERKSAVSNTWFDLASGDGGQALVDPTDFHYVYGTYFGISPYRFTDGGSTFFSNQFIQNGINLGDRSEFYTPFVMNQMNPNQLFLGTFRLYRTDNAKALNASDVLWQPISPDLTSGCPGPAPNGARNCTLSAIGVGGGQAVYTGSNDGFVFVSTDAQVNLNPTWTRLDLRNSGERSLPGRPVAAIAVDRSNYRIAYLGYNGFNAATPANPGHVFKTTDGGQHWKNITANLPDVPVNSLVLDPSFPDTLYAGTDVGPFVTRDGGKSWFGLGTGFPIVAIDQINLDTTHRTLAAGTHGRGAWSINDTSEAKPSLVLSKTDSGAFVGPGSNIDYTITVQNIGNADATGVRITDPIPHHTKFVAADTGGQSSGDGVSWTGLTVAAGASISVHLTVQISSTLSSTVKSIVDDGYAVTSTQGPGGTGSPVITPIAPPYAVTVSPATQTDGGKPGSVVTDMVTLRNIGFKSDQYNMSSSGGTFPIAFYDATCITATATTPTVASGATTKVCVKISVPNNATGTNTASIIATSVGNPSASGSATINTIAVTANTLLVDEDGNSPDTNSFYTTALTDAGVSFMTWDLNANPNITTGFMQSFKYIVWFTGNSFPGPIMPYESRLTAFLNNGGRLFLSGQDILDQAAGTTPFVANYLHVTWDGSENQNDKATNNVHEVAGTLTAGVGAVPLDPTVLGNQFMDEITPNGGAVGIFTDDAAKTDGLSFSGTYKVVFLPFAFEEYGTRVQKADLVTRVITYLA